MTYSYDKLTQHITKQRYHFSDKGPHVLRISDAILPSHPLSSPSPPALNLSQGLFQ